MLLKRGLSIVLIAIGAISFAYSSSAFSCEQAKPKIVPKVQTAKPKLPVKPKVRPLARNPYRADGSTVGCRLVSPYDSFFKQPIYGCPIGAGLKWILADGSKYYKP